MLYVFIFLNYRFIYILISLILVFTIGKISNTLAQSNSNSFNDFSYKVIYEPTNQVENSYDTLYNVTCSIDISSIPDLQNIRFKLFSTIDSTEIINRVIPVNSQGNLNGIIINNQNGIIEIDLGVRSILINDYEIKLEDINGNISSHGKH